MINRLDKRGQVTVFIIIAIVVIGAALAYAFFNGSLSFSKIPADIQPAYNSFLSCLEQDTLTGISVLESQGGYIELPKFEPGSKHMPFSSQLNVLGNPIPYWYYVSGNGIPKEQIPTKAQMESQLSSFIADRIDNCDFKDYYDQGFEVSLEKPIKATTSIKDNEVETTLDFSLTIAFGNESAVINKHKAVVDSDLGKLYASAKKTYDYEQKSLFLENYSVDTLRLYAPVDGVEISCAPLTWNADNVFDELQDAIETNTLALGTQAREDYFKPKIPGVEEQIRFVNSRTWPSSFEVSPSEQSVMIANPVGNQQGLGILGFCYVPYHFVYSAKYPVLIQVSSENNEETFQFPVAVVLINNNPKKSLNVTAVEGIEPELCSYKNSNVQVVVEDLAGNAVKADVSYECLGERCSIGQTSASGVLEENFPQCANGYVVVKSPGFKDTRYLFSTTSSESVTVLMEKTYKQNIQLKLDGTNYNGDAMVYVKSADGSTSQAIAYPQQMVVELGEGQHEVQVHIYKNSSLNVGATKSEQCIDVARSGLLGAVGLRQEKCFQIEVPSQILSNALAGGGKEERYILESELARAGTMEISAESLPAPDTIERLQNNYILFDEKGLDILFR